MQELGITALLFYVAFPERLSIGAALSTTLSAVMTGLVWYLIMAFSHYGTKDPFFYGLAGWLAYLVPRAIVQIIVGHFPRRASHRPFAFDRPHRRDDAGVHTIRVHPTS